MAINRRYGKGDLCGITTISESAYGTTDTGAQKKSLGVMYSLEDTTTQDIEEVVTCGSRTKGAQYLTGYDTGVKLGFKISRNAAWAEWFYWLLGGYTGLQNTPESRTILLKIAGNSVDAYQGACVNNLKVVSENIGKPLKFDAEIYARNKIIEPSGLVSPAAIDTGAPLCSSNYWACSNEASIGTIKSGQWSLEINQGLEKVPGQADGLTQASGEPPYLGNPSVKLSITVPATSRTYDKLRYGLKTGLTLSMRLGNYLVSLTGATLAGKDPTRSQDPYTDTLEFEATNISLTAVS